MASGDGIDSIELESATTSNNRNVEISITARSSDDNEREHASGTEGRFTNQEIDGDIAHSNRLPVQRYAKPDKERKIGHRRVGEGGEITYKKIQTSQIMGSIQLGIQHTVGSLASKPKRDLLMMDFWEIESISFPPEGSSLTPAHHYSEFRFKIYAPIAFRYFRDLFGIQPDDFMMSMCSSPLRELSNPGASGSIFYLTDDDEFIIKTVQHKEGEFLQKLLPGYYMNLNQNPRTLLPKFFGLYCFQCNSKNVRLVVMNNLLPSYVKMHLKYDLKGSTYKRKASKVERSKSSPTYKDLDFMEHHPNGIFLEADTYNALIKTIQRDCTVLESFKIMDYSLLVGVHNLDLAFKEKQEKKNTVKPKSPSADDSDLEDPPEADQLLAQEREERERGATALNRSRSINRQRLVAHSTAMESIQAESEPIDEEEDVPPGGIPARSEKGERLLLFIGIIDILQSYRLKKKLEHTFKSIIHDGDTVSVCRPSFYAQRFQNFMAKTVFKKIPSPLKHSPSKRKSLSRVAQRSMEADTDSHPVAGSSHHHHSGSSSQKAAPAPVTTQSAGLNANVTSKTISYNKSSSNINTATSLPPLKQKSITTKSKVPPPVPPRGSPKIRKEQQNNKAGNKNPNLSARCSPTGSDNKNISNGHKYKNKTLQLEEHIPKFGERLSPSNVRDWLEVNDFSKINVVETQNISPISMMSTATEVDILQNNIHRPFVKDKYVREQQNSFLSQSRRSSVGSIVRNFPPIVSEYVQKVPVKLDESNKKQYFEYIDTVFGDNGKEENIINSLTSFVEVKRDIEANFTPKSIRKKYINETIEDKQYKKYSKKKKVPSIIIEDCLNSSSVSDVVILRPEMFTELKKKYIKNVTSLNTELDGSITDDYSLEGEFV